MEQTPQTDAIVELRTVITRGTSEIDKIRLRKPAAGELRGLVLSDLLRMDATAVMTILPRISEPSLTNPEVAHMDPSDLVACAIEIAAFIMPKTILNNDQAASTGA